MRGSGAWIEILDQIHILFAWSLEPFLEGDRAINKPLPVGHLRCNEWPFFMLDPVPVGGSLCTISVIHEGRARWWVCYLGQQLEPDRDRDWMRVDRRNNGSIIVRRE